MSFINGDELGLTYYDIGFFGGPSEKNMLEKTFTTFHASNVVLLQQQYREHRITKYSELISCLIVAEQDNELLMRNHQSRLTGFKPFLEVNAISSQTRRHG